MQRGKHEQKSGMMKKTREKLRYRGFTLIELMAAMGIVFVLASMAVVSFKGMREKARVALAIADIKNMYNAILAFDEENERYPSTLNELVPDYYKKIPLDPWGSPYKFLNFSAPSQKKENNEKGKSDHESHNENDSNMGQRRKDGPIVPINTQFDLYSIGPDKKTSPSIRSSTGRDDVILANDGAFIGVAADY